MNKYHRNSAGFCTAYMLKHCGSRDTFKNEHGRLLLSHEDGFLNPYHVRLYPDSEVIREYLPLAAQWQEFKTIKEARKHFKNVRKTMLNIGG